MGFLDVLNWRDVDSVSRACWADVLGHQAVNFGGQNSGLTARNQSHGEVTAIDQSRDHTRGDVQTPRDLGLRNPRRVRLSHSRISGRGNGPFTPLRSITDLRQYTAATYCSIAIYRFTCAAWHQDLALGRRDLAWPAAPSAARNVDNKCCVTRQTTDHPVCSVRSRRRSSVPSGWDWLFRLTVAEFRMPGCRTRSIYEVSSP